VTLPDLISALDSLGVRLSARLVVDAPKGALYPELRDALADHKALLLQRVVRELVWAELSTLRWGPAARDPTPEIINDWPAQESSRATSDAAADDLYSGAEREAIRAEAGVPSPDDERQVYAEVLAEIEDGAEPPPIDVPPPVEPRAPVKWRCTNRFCRDGSRWWMSPWGVVNCTNCVPPSFPELVVAQGTETDPARSRTPLETTAVQTEANPSGIETQPSDNEGDGGGMAGTTPAPLVRP
jgi:hypothetical protein